MAYFDVNKFYYLNCRISIVYIASNTYTCTEILIENEDDKRVHVGLSLNILLLMTLDKCFCLYILFYFYLLGAS